MILMGFDFLEKKRYFKAVPHICIGTAWNISFGFLFFEGNSNIETAGFFFYLGYDAPLGK